MFHKRRLSLDATGDTKSQQRVSETSDSATDVEESPRIRSQPRNSRIKEPIPPLPAAAESSKSRDIFPELRAKARGVMSMEELEVAQGVLEHLISLSTERNAVWTRLETVLRIADKDWDGTLNVPAVNNEAD